jgi:hypothetical protein
LSDNAPLVEQLRIAFPGIPITTENEDLTLGPVNIYPHEGEWVVRTPEAHAHFETTSDAADFAIRLLRGDIRAGQLFLGDSLASTWFEEREGDVYQMVHEAVFLSPFDAEEWIEVPGRAWKQVRTSHLYNTLAQEIEATSFDRTPAPDEVQPPAMTAWLNQGLGEPPAGTKWVVGPYGKFVYLVPRGWRRTSTFEDSFQDHANADQTLLLRGITYFREAESPEPLVDSSVYPYEIEFESRPEDAGWQSYRWTMLFSDGEQDMMGILELFYLPKSAEQAEALRQLIDSTAGQSLLVPSGWDMSPPKILPD